MFTTCLTSTHSLAENGCVLIGNIQAFTQAHAHTHTHTHTLTQTHTQTHTQIHKHNIMWGNWGRKHCEGGREDKATKH